MTMQITSLTTLRATVAAWRAAGENVALVPTMGALHAGHIALVNASRAKAKRAVVSIFVNPTQFGPNEDFNRYPRPLANDVNLLREVDADAVWLPTVEEMYPQGYSTSIRAGSASQGLDGDFRPGHFDGVATVVTKLLLQFSPDMALFGEKDYQQLCVIKQLVTDLNINTRILGVPTVREADGLALSSRNAYLSADERLIAPQLHALMHTAAQSIAAGAAIHETLEQTKAAILASGFSRIDYLELRAGDSLATLTAHTPPSRLLAAVWLGKTRLIDNIEV